MTENVIEIVEVNDTLPFKHQLGKFLFVAIAGFIATKLAEKAYDSGLQAWNNHNSEVPTAG